MKKSWAIAVLTFALHAYAGPNNYEQMYDTADFSSALPKNDPSLLFTWSRLSAAKFCRVNFDDGKVFPALVNKYGHDFIFHMMVGMTPHQLQMEKIGTKFCSAERLGELSVVLPKFEAGSFGK